MPQLPTVHTQFDIVTYGSVDIEIYSYIISLVHVEDVKLDPFEGTVVTIFFSRNLVVEFPTALV